MRVAEMLRAVVPLVLTCFWSSVLLVMIAITRLRNGPDAFQPKKRQRPACLDDPQLGSHGFVTVGGIRLHYVENGDKSKPLLVLVHGFPAFWYCWHYQLKDLAKDYWVVAVDLRGYGQSDRPAGRDRYAVDLLAEDVSQLVLALGRTGCVLIGHDWGGIVAYRVAELRPTVVDKLIILNAPHRAAIQTLLRTSWNQLFRSWYVFMFQLPWLPETVMSLNDFSRTGAHLIDAFKYTFGEPGALTPPIDYYRANFSFTQSPIESPRIICPLLVVWGERDKALSPVLATMSARYADRFTVRFLPEASHWVMMEYPQEVNGHIREFIQKE
ncbi:epoxide hydrolase 4-like [Pollicipes pollicipes]|uniref:epoxide hydrolase 4-like n=1 Tax=Pollicipes pollicipes TaxID=41117 RepID=UPI0018849AD7|nr:epoxide hydrolase 4-like [Pollicipes pollicipes]